MKQPMYNTALYLRLSRDDENAGESNSIGTQRLMLRRYAEQNGLFVVDEYIDERYILGPGQKVLAVQGFTDLVLIFRPSTGGTTWGR